MNRTRRVTANLPAELLSSAQRVTRQGITQTLVRGLELVRRSAAADKAGRLKGRLHLDVDLEVSRERARRVDLIEAGLEAKEAEKERFFALTRRFKETSDPAEAERLREELARITFGE
jgi:hypothetical protein